MLLFRVSPGTELQFFLVSALLRVDHYCSFYKLILITPHVNNNINDIISMHVVIRKLRKCSSDLSLAISRRAQHVVNLPYNQGNKQTNYGLQFAINVQNAPRLQSAL